MKSEEEVGPLTRAMLAEEEAADLRVQLAASEATRIKDNESLLHQVGELKGELSRLSGVEELAFEYGTHLKCLVTSLCPVINGDPISSPDPKKDWDAMIQCWTEARERLGLNESGLRIVPQTPAEA